MADRRPHLLRSAGSMAAMTVLSRLTGYVRDSIQAVILGAAVQQELAQMLVEPNVVHRFAMAGARGSYGRVALDMDAKKGAVVLAGMADLPAGQVYRLWAQVGDRSVFCGDFRAPGGDVRAQFAVPVESYTAPIRKLFVTVEPAGPPGLPTGPHVMESV